MLGAIKGLHNAQGCGRCQISLEKSYEGVRLNVISIRRGWVGAKFPEKNIMFTWMAPYMSANICLVLPSVCSSWGHR